jgi:hypothetical protein
MAIGNFTTFKAKHVDGIIFGRTAWNEGDVTNGFNSSAQSLNTSFAALNTANNVDLSGASDALNPTRSYAFAKDFAESGNEISITDEPLLGVDENGSQNTEIGDEAPSSIAVETTIVYRNPYPTSLFNAQTKACLIKMDNSESSTTGVLYIGYNNIIVTHAGSLQRNSNGNMEQKIKFSCKGGTAATSFTTVSDGGATYSKILLGKSKAEEIQTA